MATSTAPSLAGTLLTAANKHHAKLQAMVQQAAQQAIAEVLGAYPLPVVLSPTLHTLMMAMGLLYYTITNPAFHLAPQVLTPPQSLPLATATG